MLIIWSILTFLFFTGKKAALYDDKNPDWAPSINLGHSKVTVDAASAAARYDRVKNRKRHQAEDPLAMSSVSDSCPMDRLSDSDSGSPAQTDLTHDFISKMEEEINSLTLERLALEERVKACKLDEDYFSGSDDKVKFYTGLPSFVCLMIVFDFVSDGISVSVRSVLSKFQQVVLTLMKLRLNLPVQDLAYRFSVSTSTVSRVFLNVIDVMYVRLRKLVRWPDKEELVDTMPMCFRINFGTRVVAVIDCFEVFIDRPSNLQARAETWSNYKHHNTVKFLIGITPQGAISFISKAWGGRTSDKFITENCGFLDKISAGDLVLADRGFDLSDSMALLSAYIKVPAFLKGKSQLTMADVIETRKIANVRIHVERVIGLVRQKYSILNGPIPLDYMLTSDEHDMTVLDKVAAVCCSLTNISPSIVPFN